MTESPMATQINCGQCGSVLPVEHGSHFVTCVYCGTTSFVDKARAVFHYAVRSTVREEAALSALRRWMAGNETVKDLDKKAQIERPTFDYFPMWMVTARRGKEEQVLLKPAAALSVSELEHLTVPAADLQPYDHHLEAVAVTPTVPYETMVQWLVDGHGLQPDALHEAALVHLPLYHCKYVFDGRRYTAIVDAATSRVFANIFPSKWETPYRAIGAAAFLAYLIAALIPLAGYLIGAGAGLVTGLVVYLVVAAALAVPIFIAATVISAKV